MKTHNPQLTTHHLRQGQVMLLTVVVMSGVFLSATVIAGLLMVYQLGQVTRIVDSAKAIFAADAATERALFKVFRCNNPDQGGNIIPSGWGNISVFCGSAADQTPNLLPAFLNDATYKLTIESSACNPPGTHCPQATPSDAESVKATGSAGKSARAFEVTF